MDIERKKKGLYWDRAWKLVEGCTKVSPGCDSCWSEAETAMRAGHPNEKISGRAKGVLSILGHFYGRVLCREDNLDLPLRTKKPTVWAIWNDLYHEGVCDAFRDRAYAVMALCPQHTFLVLTKRADRMAEYWKDLEAVAAEHQSDLRAGKGKPDAVFTPTNVLNVRHVCANTLGRGDYRLVTGCAFPDADFPLHNVWHGVTAENQEQADARIPDLLRVPGKRFLSIEPMLGPIGMWWYGWRAAAYHRHGIEITEGASIDAVLLGGESGKNARPMHTDWARSVLDQCLAAGVTLFFKQWGEWLPDNQNQKIKGESGPSQAIRLGKKRAGRTLDGRLHDDLPWGD